MYPQLSNKDLKLSGTRRRVPNDGSGGWVESIRKYFPKNLERLLKDRGLKKKQFAVAVGVSERTVYQWLDGDNLPELSKFDLIAKVLKTNFIELVRDPSMPLEHQLTIWLLKKMAQDVGHDIVKKS